MPDFPRWKHPYEDIAKFAGFYVHDHLWKPADGWDKTVSGSGSVVWLTPLVRLHTGTTLSSVANVYRSFPTFKWTGVYASWDKRRIFNVWLYISYYSGQIIHIVVGKIPDKTVSANTSAHIGFKVVDGTLYGTVADGTTESEVVLETFTTAVVKRLIARLIPATRCEFYVDGVLKGEATANLPTGNDTDNVLNVSICNTVTADRIMGIYDVKFFEVE